MALRRSQSATVAIAVLFPVGVSATASFSIVSQASRGCMNIQGPNEEDGAQVSTSKCDVEEPKDSQVWLFQENRLVHRTPSGDELCLDIPENNRVNGQKLQVWTCVGSEQQQFVFDDGELKTTDGAMCLDLCAEDGRTVQLWQCDGFSANQRWAMRRVGAPTMTASVSIKGWKCLDLTEEEKSGAAVQVGDCDVKSPSAGQTWILRDLQIIHQSFSGTELCLDIPDNDHTNGRQLQVWSCNGSNQQKFLNENGQFKTLDGQKCLDLRAEDDTTVQLYDCLDTENQQWVLTRLHGGETTTLSPSPATTTLSPSPATGAVSVSSGVFSACLDLTDGAEIDGTLMQVWECDPDAPDEAQVWRFIDGQIVHLTASGDELCLDIPDNQREDGVQLQVWTCSGAEQQKWVYEDGSIKTQDGSQCVDLRSEDQLTAQLWTCNKSPGQQWVLTELKPPSPGPKPTSTAAPASEAFSVVSLASLSCLDLIDNDESSGALVQVWDCDPHHPGAAQVWSFDQNRLVHHSSHGEDLCLDIPDDDRSNGARLQVWACSDADSQKFVYEAGSIQTLDGSACLDLSAEDGVTVQLWECADSKNQQWTLTKLTSSTTPKPKRTTTDAPKPKPTTTNAPKTKATTTTPPKPKGKQVSISSEVWFGCIDLAGDDSKGTLVTTTACDPENPSASQTWTFAGGQLWTSGSAFCLNAPKIEDGQRLQLSSCNGSTRQQFSFQNGELRTKNGEKCVDLKDTDSKTVQLFECNGLVNQEWVLTEVVTSLEAEFASPAFFV